MHVIAEAVQPLTKDFPDEQAAPRLQLPDVARRPRLIPVTFAFAAWLDPAPPRLVPKARCLTSAPCLVQRQPEVTSRYDSHSAGVAGPIHIHLGFVIKHQVAG